MNQHGGLLVGLMMVGTLGVMTLLIGLYAIPRYTNIIGTGDNSKPQTPGGLLKEASNTQVQANLKNFQVSILSFYAEQGAYPNSLNELVSYMGTNPNVSNIVYTKCSEGSAILYYTSSGYPGYIFNFESITPTNGSQPSCF